MAENSVPERTGTWRTVYPSAGRLRADLSLIDSYWCLAALLPYGHPWLNLTIGVLLAEAHLGQNEYDGEEYRPRNRHL